MDSDSTGAAPDGAGDLLVTGERALAWRAGIPGYVLAAAIAGIGLLANDGPIYVPLVPALILLAPWIARVAYWRWEVAPRGLRSTATELQYVNGARVIRAARWTEVVDLQLHPAPPRSHLYVIPMGLPYIVCNERNTFVPRGYDSPFGNFLLLSDAALAAANRTLAVEAATHGVKYSDRRLGRK